MSLDAKLDDGGIGIKNPFEKLKVQLPGQVKREVFRSLERVIPNDERSVPEVVKNVRSALEMGAFRHDTAGLAFTGTFLTSPFNTSDALTTEETAYAILEIEKQHQQFEFTHGLRTSKPDIDGLNTEQSLVAMLALNKNSRAPFTGSQFGRNALYYLSEPGKIILDKLFPGNPMMTAEKYGLHIDFRNTTIGSTEERLSQLSSEVKKAASTYYQRLPEMRRVPFEQLLDDLVNGQNGLDDHYAAMLERSLRGLGQRDYKILATMDQINSDLHPRFDDQFAQQWISSVKI